MPSCNFCLYGSLVCLRRPAFTTTSSYCRLSCGLWRRASAFCFFVLSYVSTLGSVFRFFPPAGDNAPPGSSASIPISFLFCFENDLISYASDANCGKSLEHTCFRVETQLNRQNIISYDLNPRTTWKLELHTNGQDLVSLLAARCTSCSIPARYGDARIERAT